MDQFETQIGYLAKIFDDTGENINNINRDFITLSFSQGLKANFTKGPKTGIEDSHPVPEYV